MKQRRRMASRTTLSVPSEYIATLEEVLRQDLSREALLRREGQRFCQRVAGAVTELSHGLTRGRDQVVGSDYLHDRARLEAYQVYYTTTNLLKIWPPLRELARSGFFAGHSSLNMLDIGTGLGAAVWGVASYLRAECRYVTELRVRATDAYTDGLRPIETFAAAFVRRSAPLTMSVETSTLDLAAAAHEVTGGPYDLITLMNVMNEVPEQHDEEILRSLARVLAPSGAIIIIEPASREESRRTLRLRERLLAMRELHLYGPCMHAEACPALTREDDWCHTELSWERPDVVRAIDDLAGTLRLSLKSTYLIATHPTVVPLKATFAASIGQGESLARAVSERFDEKGRVRTILCGELPGLRREVVMNKRDQAEGNGELLEVERYDVVRLGNVEERPNDVKIGGTSLFHTLLDANGCEIVDK